jgi:hypothetical protein
MHDSGALASREHGRLSFLGCLKIEFGNECWRSTLGSSCPALCRASTSCLRSRAKNVDGRDKPGHDERQDQSPHPPPQSPFTPYAAKNTRVALSTTSRMRLADGGGAA